MKQGISFINTEVKLINTYSVECRDLCLRGHLSWRRISHLKTNVNYLRKLQTVRV